MANKRQLLRNLIPAGFKLRAPRLVRGNESGFTLLETIIALAIMVMAFASILSVESGSINASARARQMNIVAMLAKGQMVETEYKIENKTFEEVKKEEAGQFDPPYQDYRWKTTIKEIEFPNLKIGAPGSGQASGSSSSSNSSNSNSDDANNQIVEQMTKLITQYLSKAVREVTVTITWRKGEGEQSFSVSTYWVDLNHEFQLSQ